MSRRGANSTLVLPPDLPGGNSSLSQPRAYWQLLVEYGRVHEIEPRALGRPRARARRPRCSLAARFAACPSPSRARLITAQREVGVAPGEGAAPSRAKPSRSERGRAATAHEIAGACGRPCSQRRSTSSDRARDRQLARASSSSSVRGARSAGRSRLCRATRDGRMLCNERKAPPRDKQRGQARVISFSSGGVCGSAAHGAPSPEDPGRF